MIDSYVGPDPREQGKEKPGSWENESPREYYGALSGNLIVPKQRYWDVGGFDENIEDRGQDGDFTRNLREHDIKGIYSQRVIGYHQSHDKDPKWETESVIRTIKYMSNKYGYELKDGDLPKIPD